MFHTTEENDDQSDKINAFNIDNTEANQQRDCQRKYTSFREFKRYSTENDPPASNLFGNITSGETRISYNPRFLGKNLHADDG